jgi:hypothetical protein
MTILPANTSHSWNYRGDGRKINEIDPGGNEQGWSDASHTEFTEPGPRSHIDFMHERVMKGAKGKTSAMRMQHTQ